MKLHYRDFWGKHWQIAINEHGNQNSIVLCNLGFAVIFDGWQLWAAEIFIASDSKPIGEMWGRRVRCWVFGKH
jgi:hypothetical protein